MKGQLEQADIDKVTTGIHYGGLLEGNFLLVLCQCVRLGMLVCLRHAVSYMFEWACY
jgi:hypothetical protein